MKEISKSESNGLTKEKKILLKNIMGKYSSPIDLNKVRDEYRGLDFNKIKFSNTPMSIEESVKDVEPFKWANEVLCEELKATKNKPTEDCPLSEFIKNNYDKIEAITPLNPSISRDDEWRNDVCWDELYEEIDEDVSEFKLAEKSKHRENRQNKRAYRRGMKITRYYSLGGDYFNKGFRYKCLRKLSNRRVRYFKKLINSGGQYRKIFDLWWEYD